MPESMKRVSRAHLGEIAARKRAIREALQRDARAWREARRSMISRFPEGLVWHVAVSGVASERKAERALIDAGFHAYCPLERVTIGRGAGRRDVERALFGRYLFFAKSERCAASIRDIREVKDILSTVTGAWLIVPEQLILGLIGAEGLGVFDRSDAKRDAERRARAKLFRPGRNARLSTGAFAGHIAKIVALKPGNRVECLMRLLGGEARVVVSLDDLADVA
jgi:transcription antitermination factor NusG